MAHATDEQPTALQLGSDRPVNARQARMVPQRTVQSGDVGKAGHQFGVAPHCVHINLLNNPLDAVAPTVTDNRADFRIGQRGVEVGKPLFVGARIERVVAQCMRIDPRSQSPPLEHFDRRLKLRRVHRACRGDQRHSVASSQNLRVTGVWKGRGHYGHPGIHQAGNVDQQVGGLKPQWQSACGICRSI